MSEHIRKDYPSMGIANAERQSALRRRYPFVSSSIASTTSAQESSCMGRFAASTVIAAAGKNFGSSTTLRFQFDHNPSGFATTATHSQWGGLPVTGRPGIYLW
jgi:hypothetical protein